MNRAVSTIAVTGASAVAALVFSPGACGAPAGVGSVQDALDTLVTDSGIPGDGGNPVTTITDKTVYVDVSC